MHMTKVTGLLVLLCCEVCLTIKVPIVWDENGISEVKNEPNEQVELIKPQNVQTLQQSKPIPIEYFQYTAQKPQFAADIAAFHGVQNPQEHYKAYPVRPYTGNSKPVLGIHQMLNEDKVIYQPYQNYVQKTEEIKKHVQPTLTDYEIFHPYKAEEPALQEIYKDSTLNKIRNDLQDSKNRLMAYEQEAGKPNISEDEYLEGQQKTDAKLFPQKNIPAPYEIHRPERRPVYYRVPPRDTHRDHILNQRLRHPWNQHNAKIRPVHYKPLKNHIHNLRQQHAMKYDDERNEYPQVVLAENLGEPQDGYDIYEKGKQKYTQLRNNVDESINKAVQKNRPAEYQKLELQKHESKPNNEDDQFIPIKNYAQVRKTETIKHVPRKAAFDDAETYEEILNAPRLREAVKSTKAQTVYSEEGYEDSAYDHAGEQKHASDHEGHGGFLKENENSKGRYKIPTVLGNYQDGKGSEYRDNIEHGKKWKNNNRDDEEVTESDDYSEDENDGGVDTEIYNDKGPDVGNRNKRQDEAIAEYIDSDKEDRVDLSDEESAQDRIDINKGIDTTMQYEAGEMSDQHDVDKRETNFKVPEINLNSTYLTEGEILKLPKLKILPRKDNIREKYPYYFKNIKTINKNSPLRYAENLKYMPKKTDGGTEFYDSRSILECPEVDDDVDPLPEKLKNGENPTEEDEEAEDNNTDSQGEKKFEALKEHPRLKGLGDKIDCFKTKYFGENPLDSPFFKEEIISNPEPITAPKLSIIEKLKITNKEDTQESKINNLIDISNKLKKAATTDIFVLLDKLRANTTQSILPTNHSKEQSNSSLYIPQATLVTNSTQQSNVYTDIMTNIKNNLQNSSRNMNMPTNIRYSNREVPNITYKFFQNKEAVTNLPPKLRKKRATPFVYEPYKIIKDNQFQDSKKTTTTSNISPLIRQLQSSRIADRVSRSNRDDKQVRPSTNSRTYVDIGKNDRARSNPTIIDVSIDQRRGEPRYEIRPTNHKSEYTPVENKKAMSVEDYKNSASTEKIENSVVKNEELNKVSNRGRQRFRQITTVRPFYDVSSFLPKQTEVQNVAASNAVKNTVATTTAATVSEQIEQMREHNDDSEESDEEYDDDEEEEEEDEVTTTTTTTTPKPTFRRRIRITTTTNKPRQMNEDEPERLRLVTRFRNYKPKENSEEIKEITEPPLIKRYKEEDDDTIPKYREKKKKTSKSTLVTDTKKYGDDDGDEEDYMRKKEVDALIGVKQNMDDYMPLYEKEEERKRHQSRDKEEDENEEGDDDDTSDDDDDDDDNDDDDDDDDEDDDENSDNYNNEEQPDEEEAEKLDLEVTTPEPTKRTLVRTTDAPPPTVASHVRTTSAPVSSRTQRPENKPIVTRKKIEIHKELPVNKSSPHITQFKQDIKEEEIIKEIPTTPKRKPHKKVEPLQLYKDDNLAKDINKLGDVEIFSDGIDIDNGPKHGGNYRMATKEDLRLLKTESQESNIMPLKDAEASQSENTKHVELEEYVPKRMHGGNLKTLSDVKQTRNRGRNAKLIELNDPPVRTMHGGNLKYNNQRRGGRRNEKLIELDDDRDDDNSSQDDDHKSSSHNPRTDRLHGGNYRSAKLVVENENEGDDIKVKNPTRQTKTNSVALLNSFVQAIPVLTTTPGYIVDPSKRMYYYVEA